MSSSIVLKSSSLPLLAHSIVLTLSSIVLASTTRHYGIQSRFFPLEFFCAVSSRPSCRSPHLRTSSVASPSRPVLLSEPIGRVLRYRRRHRGGGPSRGLRLHATSHEPRRLEPRRPEPGVSSRGVSSRRELIGDGNLMRGTVYFQSRYGYQRSAMQYKADETSFQQELRH